MKNMTNFSQNPMKPAYFRYGTSVIAFIIFSMWTSLAQEELKHERRFHTATLLGGDHLLVVGGWDANKEIQKSAEILDVRSGKWTAAPDTTIPRCNHTATMLKDGRILVVGGASPTELKPATIELFEPSTGVWRVCGDALEARSSHTATLLKNGKVLVAGGRFKKGCICETELFDPETGAWTLSGNMRVGRSAAAACLLQDGRVLVSGGCDFDENQEQVPLSSCEIFNPETNTWTVTGSMAHARHTHIAAVLGDGSVIVAGDNGNLLDDSEIFNPKTNTWSSGGTLSGIRGANAAAGLLSDGRLVLIGGMANDRLVKNIECYDGVTKLWSKQAELNIPRSQCSASFLPDGRIIVVGGRDKSLRAISSVETIKIENNKNGK